MFKPTSGGPMTVEPPTLGFSAALIACIEYAVCRCWKGGGFDMDKSWDKFEDKVRGLAQHIWGKPCLPTKIGGVNIDGAIAIDSEVSIHIEITEDRTLAKVRTDITKLITAKADSYSRGVLAKSFCVVNGPITNSMKEAGASHHIQVLSISEFSRLFFDFDPYSVARQSAPFGSSVDPLTGESDETAYVPVRYTIDGRVSDVTLMKLLDG
ncbi:hypothetical protein [Mesorhizobium sp. M0220]|uniref:hypothetical protein n=1 Tax=Mesorhizobium sp. M0220 TaxID=2956920 RepID=UPI00333614AF